MPWQTKEKRQELFLRNQRLDVFNQFLAGLDPRPDAQKGINDLVASITPAQREQLKQDISALTMYNCFAGTWELIPLIDRALTPYGLGVFSKLILSKHCPDCGYEWDSHNPNCPQAGNDPRTFKIDQPKGGRQKKIVP